MTDAAQGDQPEKREPLARQFSAHGLAAGYNMFFADRKMRLPRHLWAVCMALADERIRKLMLIIGPGSGKSTLISQAYPAWLLGQRPSETILGVSGGENLIVGFMKSVASIIEWSPYYREVFPDTMPDKSQGWSSEAGYFVKGHQIGDPDASYFGAGLGSASLTGKHAKTLIFDDLHNKDNSASGVQCARVVQTYYSTLLGRGDPMSARYIIAGRRFHEEDIYGHLMNPDPKNPGACEWVVLTLPAERENTSELYYDLIIPDGLICCFNEIPG